MVACSQCSTPNSVDSLFCKHCGAAIAGEARSEAQQNLQDLVSEGYRIFNEGRTEEAKLIAGTVLADEPHSTSALSLKGMCHERAGELALALEAYEKVVELNPDSALDKIKVTHLRQALAGKILVEPEPRKGRALVGAIAAVVLVVAVGAAIAAFGPKEDTVADAGQLDPNRGLGDTQAFVDSPKTSTTEEKKPDPNAEGTPGGTGGSGTPPTILTPQDNRRPGPAIPPYNGTELPGVNEGITGPIGPAKVGPPTGEITVRPDVPSRGNSGDVDPVMDGNSGRTAPADDPVVTKPTERPPVIDIRLTNPRVSTGGTPEPGANANGAEALLKAANQQFLLGKFGQAAGTYEAALRAGASPGSTNQRLGQCYANLNRAGDAANAYRRAIASYETSLRNGSGDSGRLQTAIETCKQALKTLGG